MKLSVFFCVVGRRIASLNAAERLALHAQYPRRAGWVVTGAAPHQQVVALPYTRHCIFMLGRHATGPAGNMVEQIAVVMPGGGPLCLQEQEKNPVHKGF